MTKPAAPAAFFDVDGTLIDTTIVHYYAYFMQRRLPRWKVRLWAPLFLARCGFYYLLDKVDRVRLNRLFYRNYAGLPVKEIKAAAEDCLRAIAEGRWIKGGLEAVRAHRLAGDSIVLVTGSLDFLMAPLARSIGGADVLSATLEERGGTFTGKLCGGPVIGLEKERQIRDYAARRSIDLAKCHAYGDSMADLPMLKAVGFPHVVNPDRRLAGFARRRRWPVHRWNAHPSGMP